MADSMPALSQVYFRGWLLIKAAPEWAAQRGIKPNQLCMIREDKFGELLEAAYDQAIAAGETGEDIMRLVRLRP